MTSAPEQRSSVPAVGRSVLWMVLTRAALLPLGLAQGAVLARQLGPAGLGRYSALLVDANLLVALAGWGLPGALSVLLGQEPGRLRALVHIALRHGLVVLVAPAAAVVLAATLWPALPAMVSRTPQEVALVAVLCICQYVRDVLGALLLGGQLFGAQNRQAVLLSLFQIALLLILAGLGRLDALSALSVQIAGNVLLSVLAARALVATRWPVSVPAAGLAAEARRIGVRNFLHLLPDLLLMRIDVYLIQGLLRRATAQTELGLYQAGVRIAELVLLVPSALNAVLFAKAAAREDLTRITVAGAKLSMYLGLACLLAMAFLGRPVLILLFGPRFAGSFLPCLLVLLGCSALCLGGPLAGTLAGAGAYPRSVILAQVVALLVNVGANVVLIPPLGAVGAGAASALAYAVSTAVIAGGFCRRFGISPLELLRPERPQTLLRWAKGG
ncbi:MAG: polysaccharide biosynthesis C-terminal domain-containing protein [Myxococcales bacterium]|nr:polysaccharide biosynthesis C-terminal domain-containing protein [Myxococcota bacterium]MDW8282519.1 polysaccharide biosynthesis C-terminal domain-containing protein [Myxococcales bacterium]